MSKSISIPSWTLALSIPLLIILVSFFIVQSSHFANHADMLSLGVTLDLVLMAPLAYFFLIRKASNVPKITVFPIFMLCTLAATYILPVHHHFYLSQFKTWVLPVAELGLISFIIFRIWQLRKKYQAQRTQTLDFYMAFQSAAREILPTKVASFLAMEIAAFYYGFIDWNKRTLKAGEYSYHKNSGSIPLLAVFIFLILIETLALHLLIHFLWSETIAWILTILSLYTALQMFGIVRSMPKRPFTLNKHELHLRYGIINEVIIPLEAIQKIEPSSMSQEFDEETRQLSFLGSLEGHNILLELKEPNTLHGIYGMKNTFTTLAFFVDEKEKFLKEVQAAIHPNEG